MNGPMERVKRDFLIVVRTIFDEIELGAQYRRRITGNIQSICNEVPNKPLGDFYVARKLKRTVCKLEFRTTGPRRIFAVWSDAVWITKDNVPQKWKICVWGTKRYGRLMDRDEF